MAIQHRRGIYQRFDPTKLVAGEWAVVLSGDTSVRDGKAAYICFSSGDVKRVALFEDMAENIANSNEKIISTLTDGVQSAIDRLTTVTTDTETAEASRKTAESARATTENSRVLAETGRVNAESNRTSAESNRVSSEERRASAETARNTAETNRVNAERRREEAEAVRAESETDRTSAETDREESEQVRTAAESARVRAEQERTQSEDARNQAEQARVSIEQERVRSEATRTEQQAKNNADQAANNAAAQGLLMRVLGEGEYNPQTGEPTISGETGKMYLVPVSSSGDNKYAEWLWIDGVFERVGMTGATVDPITTDDIDEVVQGTDKQGTGVLSTTGLTYLWTKLKGAFAAHSHTHSANDIESGILSIERIPEIGANKITSGILNIERLPNIPASKVTDLPEPDLSELNASNLTSGTLSVDRLPNIPASKVTDLPNPDLTHLDAGNLTSGTVSLERLPNIPASKITDLPQPDLTHLDATNIISGTLSVDRLPTIPASKVTGQVTTSQVPNLNASKITSGTLVVDRLPDIPASKVTGFQAPFYKEGYMIHKLDNTPSNVKLTRYGNLVCVEGNASRNGSSSSKLIELYTKDPDFIPKREIRIYDNFIPVVVPGYNRRYVELLYYYKDSDGVFRIHYKKLDSDQYTVTSGSVWMNFTYSI